MRACHRMPDVKQTDHVLKPSDLDGRWCHFAGKGYADAVDFNAILGSFRFYGNADIGIVTLDGKAPSPISKDLFLGLGR